MASLADLPVCAHFRLNISRKLRSIDYQLDIWSFINLAPTREASTWTTLQEIYSSMDIEVLNFKLE